jgi:AcrR family transcriptional regulator
VFYPGQVKAHETDRRRPAKRRYASPRRLEHAAQTRAAIVAAAHRLFSENGWAGTGMRDVATAAGVAVETVYSNFGSKVDLLLAALDVAVVGDSEPVPLSDRPEFAALGRGPRAARAEAAAALLGQIHARTGGIGKALREAAAGDPELDQRVNELEARRRLNVADAAGLIAQRPISATERDGLWAVTSMEVYQLLVERNGWTPEQYESWMAETILRLVGPDAEETP